MEVSITSIGIANPEYKSHQQKTAETISTVLNLKPSEKRLLKSIYKATGIEYRYSVLSDYCKVPGKFEFFPNDASAFFPTTSERMQIYKNNALTLAILAIDDCIVKLGNFDLNEITHLITVSCTGMYAPGIDIELVQQLKLNTSIKRTVINFMGCYGAFNGLKVAEAICRANPDSKVLMVCVELCTIHFQKKVNMDNIISNAIFADGAAAVLIESKFLKPKSFSLDYFHCDILPQTNKEMAWQISDSGFDIVLSSYIPEIIQFGISTFTNNLLNKYQLNLLDIDFFAIHPGGLKILQACESSLGISAEQNKYSYDILKNYGNMSSATILFVLNKIWHDVNKEDNNKKIFSCAFGPGLTLESMLLTIRT